MKQREQLESDEILTDYKDVITANDLMKILILNKNKVYNLLATKTIPSIRIDNQYRILKQDVINYLKNRL
ncbi:MAG: helix-turn-helix domain-containing protein [Bacilli bacterium]|nr:helix-turn-helix domain-containing protein [Bacilli bacterium]